MTTDQAQLEELNAYLDGELSATERRRVEERLARDADYRAELARMQQAWDALDRLPRATVDDKFARSTIEMVALAAAEEARTQAIEIPKRTRRRTVLGVLGVALAAVVGFWLGGKAWPNTNRQLLADLPVVENFDRYRVAGSIEFLQSLDDAKLFDEEPSDAK
jgi:anti-sigma factor RsiW